MNLAELQASIDAATARLKSFAPLIQALIDERHAAKAESASRLINDQSRIHSIRVQIKVAEFNKYTCEKDEDRDGVNAWHGYVEGLRWVLETVLGVKS